MPAMMAVDQHAIRPGKSIPVQKLNSPQGGQVRYMDAAVERQMTAVVFSCVVIMPPPRRGGLSGDRRPSSVCPSVCLSDVAYIGSSSKTKRPRKTKLCTGVPQVTCDSHTDFKVKRSKVKVTGRGHIVAAT